VEQPLLVGAGGITGDAKALRHLAARQRRVQTAQLDRVVRAARRVAVCPHDPAVGVDDGLEGDVKAMVAGSADGLRRGTPDFVQPVDVKVATASQPRQSHREHKG